MISTINKKKPMDNLYKAVYKDKDVFLYARNDGTAIQNFAGNHLL